MKNKVTNIFILFIVLITASKFFTKDIYIPLYGENQFTFSYLGHIKWIISDWINNPAILFQSHLCVDCQFFGMYSRWVMLWLFMVLLPGQLLHINPFVWYVFLSLIVQYIAVKYLLESIFLKMRFDKQFLLLLSVFFTTIPYKWVQIETQWEYPFVYFMFFVLIGTYSRLIQNEKLSLRNIFLSISASLLIFNIGINHLPIIIYTFSILTLVVFLSNRNTLSLIKLLGFVFVPSLLLNIPMIISLISNSDITEFSAFYSLPWSALLSLGYLSDTHNLVVTAFTVILFIGCILLASLTLKKRNLYIFTSLIACGIIFGILGKGIVFQYIFDNIPLFHTLRSAYRFVIFEHLILITLIGYLYIHLNSHKYYKTFRYVFITACLLNLLFISSELKIMNFTKIPSAYLKTYNIIKDDKHRYIYFPTKLNINHSISSDYSYGNPKAGFYWWENPFESWYPSRNIHHPTLHTTSSALNLKILELYKNNDQTGIINNLKYAGVKYIVFDHYYNWSKEAPKFDIEAFLTNNNLKRVSKSDLIEIYSID